MREFLSEYESIISRTNPLGQAGGRIDSGQPVAYEEETFSTTRYSDSATPEHRYATSNNYLNKSMQPAINILFDLQIKLCKKFLQKSNN